MASSEAEELARKAEELYYSRLQEVLEREHLDDFVAIEPESGDYFLGKTLSEAGAAARRAHPGRLTHAMRVGHKAALHIGMHLQ
jgi:hypothetical protein